MHIVIAILPYITAAASSAIALFLFFETKRLQREVLLRWNRRQQAMQAEIGKMRSQLVDLKARVEESERRAATMVAPQLPSSGINLQRRTQAIRLYRRGEKPEQIATALCVPKQEVNLLLKVHRMTTAQGATTPDRSTSEAVQ